MEFDYFQAWSVYLVAAAVAQLLFWLLVKRLPSKELSQILQLCLLAVLFTPAHLEPDSPYWVPAFMAALMESIDSGLEAGLNRLWPILSVMLALLILSLIWRAVSRRRR